MKKILFAAFVAVAAISLVGCKDKNTANGSITVSPKSIEIAVGEQQKIRAALDPAPSKDVALKYASSNPDVATVSETGIVTGVDAGNATIVVSAEGYKSDSCVVTVMSMYDVFNIADYGLFGEFEKIAGSDTTLELSIGKVNVVLANITLLAWDGNLLYSDGWAGSGFAIMATIPMYLITEPGSQYDGYYVGAGGFVISKTDAPRFAFCQPGSVNVQDYGDFLKGYIVAEKSEDVQWSLLETAFPGAQIIYVDYSDPDEPVWSDNYGIYFGHISQGYFYDPEEEGGEPEWAVNLSWHNFMDEDRHYGLKVNKNAEGKIESVVEPYDMSVIDRQFTYNVQEEQAIANRPLKIMSKNRVHAELPAFAKKKAFDRFYMAK